MKTHFITAIALSLLAGGTLNAQTNSPTPLEDFETLSSAEGFVLDPSAPEIVAISDRLLAQPELSRVEVGWLTTVATMRGKTYMDAVATAIAPKSPFASAYLKFIANDDSGWTTAMVQEAPLWAVNLAVLPTASDSFRQLVFQNWTEIQDGKVVPFHLLDLPVARTFFKSYRSTVPRDQQLAVTMAEKARLVAMQRTDGDNAWLAEVSADLIALSLDQGQ
jgi:hypothetical protein